MVSRELRFSAGDRSGHLACRHRTVLDEECARGTRKPPPLYDDPIGDLLRERGFAHEAAYVASLGDDAVRLDDEKDPAATLAAMRRGVPLIVQPTLAHDRWLGRADILRRVDGGHYEVIDTKLSAETRAATILQLCLYTEFVGHMFGKRADVFHVVSPHPTKTFHSEPYRFDEYAAYYRHVRDRLATWRDPGTTYPDPVEACDFCRWWQTCDARHRADDSTWLVAGISRGQKKELDAANLGTLASLARAPKLDDALGRTQLQARMQLEGRESGKPVHELLPVEPERGLSRLPAPSPGDVFFDLEGDRMASAEGREFLFGLVADGTYHARWAMTDADERAAFEWAIDFFTDRLTRHPDAHIYHYAPYEPSAMKRLMGRYGTREDALDVLLRGERFVDLCSITKQSLRASVERYSIKDLEKFYNFKRTGDLRQAGPAVRAVRLAIAAGDTNAIAPTVRDAVEVYNREDCESTEHLRDWLESIRSPSISRPAPKDGAAPEELDAERAAVQALVDKLCANEPPGSPRWILAQMLEYYRREKKVFYWEKYRLAELTSDEALDERKALGGLVFLETVGLTPRKLPIDRYRFPVQDHELDEGDKVRAGDASFGEITAIDSASGTVDIKKMGATAGLHPEVVFCHPDIQVEVKQESLARLAEAVLAGTDPGPGWALLNRTPPRAFTVLALDGDVLPIQGPPGTGKTYTAGKMMLDLVRAGKRVGVTALSHKVIRHVLHEVAAHVRCYHKGKGDDDGSIRVHDDPKRAVAAMKAGEVDVVGGTAWLWSRADMHRTVDVLIVDEAGQMSLADTLAVAQSARSLVLVGDPRQLEQPQQGSHPDGAEVSALEHLFGDKMTIPEDRGIFLPTTHRMSPALCAFTSEQFYENRLQGIPELANQSLVGPVPYAGTGLFYVPVDHDTNQNRSPEEVAVISRLVDDLLTCTWTNKDGASAPLRATDILVVAPYNAQVDLLSAALAARGVPCGTVDKFQGQQAPVVIFSAATSTPDDAPRGMEFLYSLNRLNVATSRARCICLLVASPRLFEPECRTPRQIRLANAWCRYLELAKRTTF